MPAVQGVLQHSLHSNYAAFAAILPASNDAGCDPLRERDARGGELRIHEYIRYNGRRPESTPCRG
jgi:hypothetical protein